LLSHADADHAGGALAVQRGLPVAEVLSGESGALPESLRAGPCQSGRGWQWNGVSFRLWQALDGATGNQRSCVLQVEASGERLLLTGDIDTWAEARLLAGPLAVATDWLQAPHHGSRSSSSMALLQGLSPSAVLISRGHGNAFGHPHPEVVERYRRLGAGIYDSARHGAIKLQLGTFTAPEPVRGQRRFWRQ